MRPARLSESFRNFDMVYRLGQRYSEAVIPRETKQMIRQTEIGIMANEWRKLNAQ